MAAIRFLLVVFCLAGFGRCWGTERSVVTGQKVVVEQKVATEPRVVAVKRLLDIARAQLGVREKTGKNDGIAVESYLKYVGFTKGNPWCAAYVCWVFGQAGYPAPRTAWSPGLFPANRVIKDDGSSFSSLRFPKDNGEHLRGLVFGIYFPDLKRIGHCGLVDGVQGDFIISLEGNTNLEGSREGQGVYRRLRHKRTIYKYADWL
ncbi:hypothetical protein ACVWYN_000039 [Pedobacter sp. UYP24]